MYKIVDRPRPNVVLFIGMPSCGATTQARRRAKRSRTILSTGKYLQAIHLSSEALLRKEGNPRILALMAAGKRLPINDVRRVMGKAIRGVRWERPIVLDGIARQPEEAEWLLRLLAIQCRSIKAVVWLQIGVETSRTRQRKPNLIIEAERIHARRLHQYYELTIPALELLKGAQIPILEISGEGTPDEVEDRIQLAFKEARTLLMKPWRAETP